MHRRGRTIAQGFALALAIAMAAPGGARAAAPQPVEPRRGEPPGCILVLPAGPPPAKVCQGGSVTVAAQLSSLSFGFPLYTLRASTDLPGTVYVPLFWQGQITLSPPVTTSYVLTLTTGTCQRSLAFTVQVETPPSLGTAFGSAARHQSDPLNLQTDVALCCGSGLKLHVGGAVVGTVQWQASNGRSLPFADIPGVAGTDTNVNPNSPPIACPPQPATILLHAVATTDPVCRPAVSNAIQATVSPPSQAGTLAASPPVLCDDGASTSTVSLTLPFPETVTWFQQPGCTGPFVLMSPQPAASFTVGPLRAPICYRTVVQSGPCDATTRTIAVGVESKPVPGTVTAVPARICPGDDSVLTLAGQSGVVQWLSYPGCLTPPPGVPLAGATGNTVEDTNILQQTACYGVRVTSPTGVCPAAVGPLAQVTVDALPSPPAIGGAAVLCAGGQATLQVTAPIAGATYQWFLNGLQVGGGGSSLAANQPGNYGVTVTTRCGSADSPIHVLTLDPLAVTIQGPCCSCATQPVRLCATPVSGTATSYSWTPGGQTAQCVTVNPPATTPFTVTATDANGCRSSAVFTVTVCR